MMLNIILGTLRTHHGEVSVMKTWYPSVTISSLWYFDEYLILRKMQVENPNKIHYGYKAMVVQHICNIFLVFHHQGSLETKLKS